MIDETVITKLAAPFNPAQVSWRVGRVSKSNKSLGQPLAYIDARDVMDRLDVVVGAGYWSDSYVETLKGRIICTISIWDGEKWIGKSDGAGETSYEGDKGAISDAYKRAAVRWGVGRYLYAIKAPWTPIEPYGNSYRVVSTELPKLALLLPSPIDFEIVENLRAVAQKLYGEENKEYDLCLWKSGNRAKTYDALYQSEGESLLKGLEGKLKK